MFVLLKMDVLKNTCEVLAITDSSADVVNRLEDYAADEMRQRMAERQLEFGPDLIAVPFTGVLSDERATARLQADLAAQQHGTVVRVADGDEVDEDGDEVLDPTEVWPAPKTC